MIHLKLQKNKKLSIYNRNDIYKGENNFDVIKIENIEEWKDYKCTLNLLTSNTKLGDIFIMSGSDYAIKKELLTEPQDLYVWVEMRKDDIIAKSSIITLKVSNHYSVEDVITDTDLSIFQQVLNEAIELYDKSLAAQVEAVKLYNQSIEAQGITQDLYNKSTAALEQAIQIKKELDALLAVDTIATKTDVSNAVIESKKYTDEKYAGINTDLSDIKAIVDRHTQEIAKKADTATVNAELNKKADLSTVNAELDKKADTITVNAELDKKVNTADYNTKISELSLKNETQDAEIKKKVDTIDGKQLSDENYTLSEKQNVAKIPTIDESLKGKAEQSVVQKHIDATNPHNITKATIDLSNVDNTSDKNKPISDATKTYVDNGLKLKADKTEVPILEEGKIPEGFLPSYVDDIIEGTLSTFPETGESGKIYVDTDKNLSYRWSGTQYIEVSPSIALGETSSTAYPGDKGKLNATSITQINETLPTKQNKEDQSLMTNDKTVAGAINENHNQIGNIDNALAKIIEIQNTYIRGER